MENKHTPGPWRVDGLFLNQLGVWASTGAIVAEIRLGSHENADGTDTAMENDEYDANAALIAASPDMYEALKACAAFVEMYTPNGVTEQPPRRFMEPADDSRAYALGYAEPQVFAAAARAALAKAEGRA